jgi:cold shock CspA family protein/ribosome-associated translation inhibitor RaiA
MIEVDPEMEREKISCKKPTGGCFMEIPLEITYRGVQKTDGIESLIREKAAKLDRICDKLISCRVAVESPQQHQNSGSPFRVRINMRIPPGHELVVRRESSKGDIHDPLHTVLRTAFEAAYRQLKEHTEKKQGDVKTKSHVDADNTGFVIRLFREEGYGFLKNINGEEYYFHRNSVLQNDFERLEIGTGVRFFPSEGDEGPSASSIHIIDKPGVRVTEEGESPVETPRGW